MRILLSLPPNLVKDFHTLEGVFEEECFCTYDSVGVKLGSGGRTCWILEICESTFMKINYS